MMEAQWSRGNFICVGLDTNELKMPAPLREGKGPDTQFFAFCMDIVGATCDLVFAYLLNLAFFARHGEQGMAVLRRIIAGIHRIAPDVPVILDAKFGDIGSTNLGYVDATFSILDADAVTVSPYLGGESLKPFLAHADKGIIVLCRTSNPGAGEFQDLPVNTGIGVMPLYQYVAHRAAKAWNEKGNCCLVVGATYPHELADVRGIVGGMPILIPDIGAQSGDVEKTVAAGKNSHGTGMIIGSSRGIIYASDGADYPNAARRETKRLRDQINQYR